MVRVAVKIFATLRQFLPEATSEGIRTGSPIVMDVPDGTNVSDILGRLGVPREHTKLVFVNGRHQGLDYTLQDGDELGLFPPVAGG